MGYENFKMKSNDCSKDRENICIGLGEIVHGNVERMEVVMS